MKFIKQEKNINNEAVIDYIIKNYNSNKKIMYEMIKYKYLLLRFADNSLKNDKSFVIGLKGLNNNIYKYISKNLQDDPEIKQIFSIK